MGPTPRPVEVIARQFHYHRQCGADCAGTSAGDREWAEALVAALADAGFEVSAAGASAGELVPASATGLAEERLRPQRVQIRRTWGWRMPAGAVNVARPTQWGNAWRVGSTGWTVNRDRTINREPHPPLTAAQAVESYRNSTATDPDLVVVIRAELHGKDLACWCPLDRPCHADVLLALANPTLCCTRCDDTLAAGICCPAHDTRLCHGCYRETHAEACGPGCRACAREGLGEQQTEHHHAN